MINTVRVTSKISINERVRPLVNRDEGEEFLYLFITFLQNFVLYQLPSGVQCIKHLLGLLYVALSKILIDT